MYCTLEEAQTAGAQGTVGEITSQILLTSALIDSFCGTQFVREDSETKTFRFVENRLYLKTPLISVQEILIDQTSVNFLDFDTLKSNQESNPTVLEYMRSDGYYDPLYSATITGSWGWEAIPAVISSVCAKLVAIETNSTTVRGDIKSLSVEGYSVSFKDASSLIPIDFQEMLSAYKITKSSVVRVW